MPSGSAKRRLLVLLFLGLGACARDARQDTSAKRIPASAADPAPDPMSLIDECLDPRSGWIFCTGFEEGDLSLWDDWDGNPPETNLLMEDPGPLGLAGNHVLRLRVPPGEGTADVVKQFSAAYDTLYARWYVQWEPGYDFDAPCHGGGLHAGSRSFLGHSGYRPEGDDWFSAWIEPRTSDHRLNAYVYYRGMYQDCADPLGSCWGDHLPCLGDEGEVYCTKPWHRETVLPPVLETGRWYCIEMKLAAGHPTGFDASADGVLDFWIDGQQIGPWTDLWLRTTDELKLTVLWLSLYHHDEHSVEGLLLDNVVVSTRRIGSLDRPAGVF